MPPSCVAEEGGIVSVSDFLHQQREDRVQVIVGHFSQFGVGAILHRVRHENISRVGAKGLRLDGGGVDKLGGRDTNRWDSAGLEIRQVMRTARRAGASVRQPFDDDIHFADHLLP